MPDVPRTSAALIVAHPGHELRLHHWLERQRPLVFVLTDGSGGAGRSRVPSTQAVLRGVHAPAGSILGRFSDEELYRCLMTGEIAPVVAVTCELGDALAACGATFVVADAWELYNPVHDLCRVIASLAVERARVVSTQDIADFEYAVVGSPMPTSVEGEIVLELDASALQRKLDAAAAYPELRADVTSAIGTHEADAFRVEALRPTVPWAVSSASVNGKPFYETHGEEQVASGKYAEVLRYREHVLPFLIALAAEVRATNVAATA